MISYYLFISKQIAQPDCPLFDTPNKVIENNIRTKMCPVYVYIVYFCLLQPA
jgi:hypothetical protein